MEMESKLDILHGKLVEAYMEILDRGTDDPRVLKELREFLRDNDITEETIAMRGIGSNDDAVIEFPDDFEVAHG